MYLYTHIYTQRLVHMYTYFVNYKVLFPHHIFRSLLIEFFMIRKFLGYNLVFSLALGKNYIKKSNK